MRLVELMNEDQLTEEVDEEVEKAPIPIQRAPRRFADPASLVKGDNV